MKVTLKILLAVAVVLLAYMCYRSIMGPIEFKDERDRRENLIKARLIDIRKAQIEYKNIHKVHAANFDELSKFLKDEKLPNNVSTAVTQTVSRLIKPFLTASFSVIQSFGEREFLL